MRKYTFDKNVGMIPFILHRDYGFNSYMISFRNGNYPSLKTEVPGLKQIFLKKKILNYFNKIISKFTIKLGHYKNNLWKLLELFDFLPALLIFFSNFKKFINIFKKIDLLQLYHIRANSFVFGYLYHLFNPNGKLILKLDLNPGIKEIFAKNPAFFRLSKTMEFIDEIGKFRYYYI